MNDAIIEALASVPAERTYQAFYEDLVMSPKAEISRLCDFLELPFEPVMLEHSRFERPIPKGRGSENASRPIDRSYLKDWQSALTPSQVVCIESLTIDDRLRERYRPEGAASVGFLSRVAISAHANTLHYLLRLFERTITLIRGRPLVWTSLGSMGRSFRASIARRATQVTARRGD